MRGLLRWRFHKQAPARAWRAWMLHSAVRRSSIRRLHGDDGRWLLQIGKRASRLPRVRRMPDPGHGRIDHALRTGIKADDVVDVVT
ncbi:hypothetical protein ACI6Q5_19355 [Xanthomonas codiaei]|uniref:Uncharacterized protein n=1 Tax=Xanthomonas codiaei TaxID=56463 RepID=A0A2S7CJ60_9XANT|nr:hypothetical protein XcodCFBP4690_15850 [Xanthomonas codiaei]